MSEYLEYGELNNHLTVNKLQYLVVGTGRCGTVYLAKLLSSLGIYCGHEAIFDWQGLEKALIRLSGREQIDVSRISKIASNREEAKGIKWFNGVREVIAESSYMAAPFLDHECLQDVKIIHVVREPMKVINSFVAGMDYFSSSSLSRPNFNHYHEFIYKYIPRLYENMAPITRAALFYVKWNEMIEEKSKGKPYQLYRVESDPRHLFDFLGVKAENYYKNTRANHKEGIRDIYHNFDQIPDQEIRKRLQTMRQKYYGLPVI